ncbi:GNAT family N-acetyltransferase [Streptomyces sp. NPDC060031]|uniref:GNAT family N-acetyltransferase n=1 Tax=Streptomyces sp. NPDC060031 TaxID=3347043 RepID=UPI0036B98392
MQTLAGHSVALRRATSADASFFRAALATEEVAQWWGNGWPDVEGDLAKSDHQTLAIVADGSAVGMIQWWEDETPITHQAGIDMFLHPDYHRRGYGSDALLTLVRWLLGPGGHHRVMIDPATDNLPAIACYEKIGFRRVGVFREFWKDRDGVWRDSLLLDLLAKDIIDPKGSPAQ